MRREHNKRELGHIIIDIHNNDKELELVNKLHNKLIKLGYESDLDDLEDYEDLDYFFIQIDKDKKECFSFNQIWGPASMANDKLRPIPISWLIKDFNKIMSIKTNKSYLIALEQQAFNQFND